MEESEDFEDTTSQPFISNHLLSINIKSMKKIFDLRGFLS